MTMETSTGSGTVELGGIGVLGTESREQGVGLGRVALVEAIDLGETDADEDFVVRLERLGDQALQPRRVLVEGFGGVRQRRAAGALAHEESAGGPDHRA